MSRPLLAKLKSEIDQLKRGFPLPMIQRLCRKFEKEGLKFFKRGKKTLYVSVVRPRGIADEEAFTDRIRKIVAFVRENPQARVVQLLDALVPDYDPPPGGESFEEHHLTQAEHDVLADLRWLTMEGYVIEFPNSELLIGRRDDPNRPPPPKKVRKPSGEKPAPQKEEKKTAKAEPEGPPKPPGKEPAQAEAVASDQADPPPPSSGASVEKESPDSAGEKAGEASR